MIICFECTYCGHRWNKTLYYTPESSVCEKCKDTNVKIKKIKTIDYYGDKKKSNKPDDEEHSFF